MASVPDSPEQDFHLLETMRHEAARGLLSLDAHLQRLTRSAAHFGFDLDPPAVRSLLLSSTRAAGDARVRLSAFRDGRVEVELGPLPAPLDRPVVLALDDEPIDSQACWPHHKTSRRAPYDVRRARHPHVDDVVLINERGELTEVTTANLAVELDGRWWTPPFGDGCLPGVERERLLRRGVLQERVLKPHDLHRASALAVMNALRGWRPAVLATPRSPEARPTSIEGTR